MSPALLRLAAELLDLAADQFSNHGCNDFGMTGRFTADERAEIAALMSGGRSADELTDYAEDWLLMRATARGLRYQADEAATAKY
jgi:hypothetical protein